MGFFSFRKNTPALPPLYLKNTMTRSLEAFSPLQAGRATMYTCGPTVYDFVHIGNLRSYVFADILKRTLLLNGYWVNHTINITDFGHLVSDADQGDDKMMVALRREGKEPSREAMLKIADRYTEAFEKDMDALGNLPPSQYARASEYIRKEIALVAMLREKGYTYDTSDGVYFDVERFPQYGKLGNINLAALKEGARVEANPEKRHPADFAIWKKGELGWDAPWGKGFPGWHIECTAMVFATLGKQIDIHTGGIDHIATHHNGEIAQAEAATGKAPYVRYWLHNAFITLEDKRIGKSVGNAITLTQLKERGYPALAYRFWLLTGRYDSPMNFTFEALDGAKQAHYKLRRFMGEELRNVRAGNIEESYERRFIEAMNDNLDTPKAIALIFELIKDSKVSKEDKRATIEFFDETLALGLSTPIESEVKTLAIETLPADIQELIRERETARKEKRWDDADALRETLNLKGYLVEDSPQGTKVTKAS